MGLYLKLIMNILTVTCNHACLKLTVGLLTCSRSNRTVLGGRWRSSREGGGHGS